MSKKVVIALIVLAAAALGLVGTRTSTRALPESSSAARTLVDASPTRARPTADVVTLHPSGPYAPLSPDSVELYWDDGGAEGYWWIQSPSGPNDYMAVVFTPPASPYTILSCRVYGYQDGTASFAECMVCPGTASIPDIANPYAVVSGQPTMPSSPGWVYTDLPDTTINNTNPLWFLVHWPNGSFNGPYIGGDITSPDGYSYWSQDGSVWNNWTADDFMERVSIDVTFQYGAIDGTVSEMGGGVIAGAIVTANGYVDTTDAAGYYYMDVLDGTYDVTASAFGYNSATAPGIVVTAPDTVTVDFELTYPLISVWPTSFSVTLPPDTSLDTTLFIYNTGNGPLDFSINVITTGDGKAFGDSIFGFPINESVYAVGCEYAQDEFFVSCGQSELNVNVYDHDGVWQRSFSQFRSSGWGWRDIAWDGSWLYASDDGNVTAFGTDGSDGGDFSGPENPNRALAYDPLTDHFWTANFSGPIYEFDRTGAVINTYGNAYAVYGMGWDDVSSYAPCVWVAEQTTPAIRRFDPATGTYDPTAVIILPEIAGGTALTTEWDPTLVTIVQLVQASPDRIIIYEVDAAPPTWLDANPRSGSVAAGDTFQVTVTFNSAGLAAGVYVGELRIMNNSATPEVVVPCTLTVITGTEEAVKPPSAPRVYALSQNSPNPVSGSTVIAYQLPAKNDISLNIYDATGRMVTSLVNGSFEPGFYETVWDGRDSLDREVPIGVYFYRLRAGNFVASKKLVVLR